jgi:ubiquitin-conjugating enzyme E2 J2
MMTPSGRFQPSTRLCLTISDFHPKSFNPTWEVSTILTGLLSFMTSEEIATGAFSAPDADRRAMAARSRWWNSTAGGSHARAKGPAPMGNVAAGDGGAKFRAEWADVDKENWEWMRKNGIDAVTGRGAPPAGPSAGGPAACGPQLGLAGQGSGHQRQVVVDAVVQQRDAGTSWLGRNKLLVLGAVIFVYVLIARLVGSGK